MAYKGSGNVGAHAGMKDPTSSTLPRSGAAKRTQTSFPIKEGMKDQTDASKLRGASPRSPGFDYAPDASSANPLDPTTVGKKVQTDFPAKWGMTDANGDSVNGESGKQVLSEASLLGR